MAPLDFKHFTSARYRPGEDDAVNYYAQKRKKQYHGNEGKEVKELSMKSDKKLPNLKVPAKGKKGVSKFMRKKAITQMKDAVQSADRKPEKYMKPDGKVGIRMVKTDKEVIKKEASVLKPTKPTDIIKHAKTLAKNPRDYMMNKKKYLDKARAKVFKMYPREEVEEAINHDDAHRDAQTHSDGSMSVKKIPSMIKKPGDKHLHLHMKSYHKEKDGQDFAKKHGYKVKNYVKTPSGTRMDIHKEDVNEATHDPKHVKQAIGIASDPRYKKGNMTGAVKAMNKISKDIDKHPQVAAVLRRQNEMVDPMDLRGRPKKKDPNPESPYGMKHPLHPMNIAKKKAKEAEKAKKEDVDIDEALNLQQRMKRSRLMKRMKSRIKIGRQRAMRKMANKKTIEKRAMRQARNQLAKKLTRGIPKKELTFARKQEIEKRLAKPALQSRIKRIAKRIFKDVRKAEVQRKKG